METIPFWMFFLTTLYAAGWVITCAYITIVKDRVDKTWAVPVYALLSVSWFVILPAEILDLID